VLRRLHARLSTRGLGAATFVVLALLFVGLTVLFDQLFRGARLDLTQNRLYTLSDGTRNLVGTLREPINLYFYFSRESARDAPFLGIYATRVQELLEEIAARSDGSIRLHVIDPAPFSEEEERAAELGLKAVPLGVGSEPVYFGLAGTNSTDGRALIEFFQPQKEEFLEYDVARLIHALAEPRRRAIGLVSSLPVATGFDPEAGGMRAGWAIEERITEVYELRTVAPDASALPDGLDALIVVHPKGLSAGLKYAIDRYVAGGGRLLLFVDPDAQQDESATQRAALYAGGDRTSTFEPMLGAWGVTYDPLLAFGDLANALLVGDADGQPVRHLAFAAFGAGALATGDPVTAALETVNAGTPGFLVPAARPGVRFEPLITSSTEAAPIPVEKIAMSATPDSLRAGFRPTGQRYVLAARLTGTLPSAYANGPPDGVAPLPALAPGPATVIVVADTDLLSDMLWMRTQTMLGERYIEAWANNADFVLNALDQLTGSADLIGIRGRAPFARPFTRVEALRERADERLQGKELELQRELQATEQKLVELQTRRDDQSSIVLTPEQQAEIDRFRQEKLRIRKELRDVQRGLRVEIDLLGTVLKLLNILAVPMALSKVALVVLWVRRRRRRAAAAAAPAAEAAA
jgi:ABC-type uncharacterized transport system involved in gliding motility auxiliary subunit